MQSQIVVRSSAVRTEPVPDDQSKPSKGTRMNHERVQECRRVRDLLEVEKRRVGMTQTMLARMIGRSPKLISAIVNERTPVTVNTGRALSRVFAVPLSAILPWTRELSDSDDAARYAGVIDDLNELSEANRLVALRMIKKLADSQE